MILIWMGIKTISQENKGLKTEISKANTKRYQKDKT